MINTSFLGKLNPAARNRERIRQQNERVAQYYSARGMRTTFDIPSLKFGIGSLAIILYILSVALLIGQFYLAVNIVEFPVVVAGLTISFTALFAVSLFVCLALFMLAIVLGIKFQDTHRFALVAVDFVTNTLPLYIFALVMCMVVLFLSVF